MVLGNLFLSLFILLGLLDIAKDIAGLLSGNLQIIAQVKDDGEDEEDFQEQETRILGDPFERESDDS